MRVTSIQRHLRIAVVGCHCCRKHLRSDINMIYQIVCLVVGVAAMASGQTICEQFGSTQVAGRYVVMNNRWGTDRQQCIEVQGTGFRINQQDGQGTPASYPAIFFGCHYDNCSPGTNLPMRLRDIWSVQSSISCSYVDGPTYNAAYDIWLDPNGNIHGVNQQEIMIWLTHVPANVVQPIGSQVGTVNLVGRNWAVWIGSNGSNQVISYVLDSPTSSLSFSVLDFINDGKSRGLYDDNWFLTSIQAGFEPWNGGAGLAVNDFSASVN